MKKVLFVINTLGCAGAETALVELLRSMEKEYDISLFVLMNQGEMIHRVPEHVKVLNKTYSDASVLSKEGARKLRNHVLKTMFCHGSIFKNFGYVIKNFCHMLKNGKIMTDKLLWRVMSDGAQRFDEEFDLAVSYLEGGSAYYVADHVKAKKKAGFIHIAYEQAGYTRALDCGCYDTFSQIFTVSDEVKTHFLEVYPEHKEKMEVFHNLINQEGIREKATLPGGFEDDFTGTRLLTVGRLTTQKAYEVSIEAMSLLKKAGANVRWYVLGEGDQRKFLEEQIEKFDVKEDFLLLGAKSNPYPYYAQTDLYVHATRFEGKSIAIQEAQTLGCTLLVSDCSGNREQVEDGVDGKMCDLTPESICQGILQLIQDPDACKRYGEKAAEKILTENQEIEKLRRLL